MQALIEARRDGRAHSEADLRDLALAAARGTVPDYQLAAWLMAAYLNPITPQETAWLTMAMADSGERADLGGLPKPWLDKHSTGGVGDKTTIVVLPILAACGLTVVKMSGRGLGITGGTVDKLSSVPGMRLNLTPDELRQIAGRTGIALTGQTPDLAPADKALYALRDATATVDSIPLIVSSILSKKLAGSADTVLLDVKCGAGSFMPTLRQAKALGRALAETARLCGLNTRIAITDMSQPLGAAVGNALEVREAVATLTGETLGPGTDRFRTLCVRLAGMALEACGRAESSRHGRRIAEKTITDGSAAEKARQWFFAQGATADVVSNPAMLEVAPVRREMFFRENGWVSGIAPDEVARAVIVLGGGRKRKEDPVDLGVGLVLQAQVGSKAEAGAPLATIYARSEEAATQAEATVAGAVAVSRREVSIPKLVLAVR